MYCYEIVKLSDIQCEKKAAKEYEKIFGKEELYKKEVQKKYPEEDIEVYLLTVPAIGLSEPFVKNNCGYLFLGSPSQAEEYFETLAKKKTENNHITVGFHEGSLTLTRPVEMQPGFFCLVSEKENSVVSSLIQNQTTFQVMDKIPDEMEDVQSIYAQVRGSSREEELDSRG